MTAAADRIAREHAREHETRVRTLRRGVEQAVLAADMRWLTDDGLTKLIRQLVDPLMWASTAMVAAYATYVREYAREQGGPPPMILPPEDVSPEAARRIAALGAVVRMAVRQSRQRRETDREMAAVVASITGGAATKAASRDAHDYAKAYLTGDPGVVAYRRVPDSDPCYFCALLASRGFVYRDAEFYHQNAARGDYSVLEGWHDGCCCTSQAGFRNQPLGLLDPTTEMAQDVYENATADYDGLDKARAFRRAWEARRQK